MKDLNILIEDALKKTTQTKSFVMGRDVLRQSPALFQQFFPGQKALIVADVNTWRVAGEQVYNYFQQADIPTERFLFPDEHFHAEWKYIEMLDEVLTQTGAIAVSVGSGVINDLCKLTAHHHNDQSYLSIATAASVDGYTSFGASITYENAKQTFDCPAPVALLADTNILAEAPKAMTAAGYADLAAKVPAGGEWMIADVFGTEPILPDAWHVLQDVLDDLLANPAAVAAGDPEAIGQLFAGLTLSGFAMQMAGSSRPASCTDHLFSHILDMTGHRFNGELQSHGFQVAIGTLTTSAFFDTLLTYDLTQIDADACASVWPTLEAEQQRALDLFKDFPAPRLGYTEITKKYNDAETVRRQLNAIKAAWPELRTRLQGQVYTYDKMRALFATVGAPSRPEDIGTTWQQIRDMVPYTQLMRWRINMLDLGKRAGFYDRLVADTFARLMA